MAAEILQMNHKNLRTFTDILSVNNHSGGGLSHDDNAQYLEGMTRRFEATFYLVTEDAAATELISDASCAFLLSESKNPLRTEMKLVIAVAGSLVRMAESKTQLCWVERPHFHADNEKVAIIAKAIFA
jgi:hypothetical protein